MHHRRLVHLQVAAAIALAAAVLGAAYFLFPQPLAAARADLLLAQAFWFALPLALSLFAAMYHRGRSETLVLGAASAAALPAVISANLTNTVEQTLLAVLALAAYLWGCPNEAGAVVPAFTALFVTGRALFFVGYRLNPMARFFGYAMNFYGSGLLLALSACHRLF